MKTIHVSASRSYDILIERGILTRAGEEIKKVCGAGEALIVSEDTVWPLYGETVLSSMKNAGFDVTSFTFPHGEQSKNLSVYAEILNALAARHISRKGLIVALGGGVVGDLTGFAASTYLRGIGFIRFRRRFCRRLIPPSAERRRLIFRRARTSSARSASRLWSSATRTFCLPSPTPFFTMAAPRSSRPRCSKATHSLKTSTKRPRASSLSTFLSSASR